MPVSRATSIEEASDLLLDAPSPVVVIAVYNSFDDVVQCLEAVAANTSSATAILVVDDAGSDRRFASVLAAAELDQHVVVLHHDVNHGFVRSCNAAFEATAGRDVVLLNSDVIVGPGWLEGLTAAATSSDDVATASTMTNHGTLLSVPNRNRPTSSLPGGMTPHEAADRVAAGSLRLRPTIPTAVGHCCYIKRAVLDLVGGFDEQFSPGYGEEVDFSQRAVIHGFRHVCADDVFTYHRGGGSFGDDPVVVARRDHHEEIVRRRYPWYGPWVQRVAKDPSSPLADALGAARRALIGIEIGVDALALGPDRMGTQQIIVETLRVLARRKEIRRLVAFVPMHCPPYVTELRAELPDVQFVAVNPVVDGPLDAVDLLYRPYQVSQLAELDFIHGVGQRFVVNQLDLIAFSNPAYFAADDNWLAYRDLQRLTLELADGLAFLSEHSRRIARSEGLVDAARPSAVVSCGISEPDPDADEVRPPSLTDDDAGFILCIGASYLHKNRRFALEVWAEVRRRGWSGRIVLAGPTPPNGNSLAREAEFLLGRADLRSEVVTLGSISESEKRWLYRRAALVLYPSVVEGFGLVPFEAAGHGVPVLATRQGSMNETLPESIPTLDGFSVDQAADTAWALLHDPEAARRVTDALRERGAQFEWARTGDLLVELFQEVLRRPSGKVLVIEGEGEHPTGLASRAHRRSSTSGASVLERMVGGVISRPALKSSLSPDGSRRQRLARNVISQARRQRDRA